LAHLRHPPVEQDRADRRAETARAVAKLHRDELVGGPAGEQQHDLLVELLCRRLQRQVQGQGMGLSMKSESPHEKKHQRLCGNVQLLAQCLAARLGRLVGREGGTVDAQRDERELRAHLHSAADPLCQVIVIVIDDALDRGPHGLAGADHRVR
jgi:hypothetical protein